MLICPLVVRRAGRDRAEDGLGSAANSFHPDGPSSEVRLNVDRDTVLTVLANGCYRWLGKRLRGFEKASPKHLYRRFVETSGRVEVEEGRVVIRLDRRSHTPVLREAALDRDVIPVPWLRGHSTSCVYP